VDNARRAPRTQERALSTTAKHAVVNPSQMHCGRHAADRGKGG